jgi:transcriptional regulator with XRE-family HTH domain
MDVPQRTLPFPASTWEVAVDAVLRALRDAAAAAGEELGASEPDLSLLGTHAEEIGRSAASLLERWRHLDETSPYRDGALEIAVTVVDGVMQTAQAAGPAMESAIALEEELANLVLAAAKWQVGITLRRARGKESLRAMARRAVLSVGYLSELETGQAGLPSEQVCLKLDGALKTDVDSMARTARNQETQLRQRAASRRARQVALPPSLITLGPRANARMQTVIGALVRDPHLMELTEGLMRLGSPARRGIQKLVAELLEPTTGSE